MRPKALLFDVFGTVVDWRRSIIEEGLASGIDLDWALFADRWRAGYAPSMERVRRGELPWTNLDVLHRMILDELLREFRIEGLSEEQTDHLNRVWHRLKPWPDSVAGLIRLKAQYIIAPLSNGNISLLTNTGKRAGLPWDLILSAELAKHYKPDREVYLTAIELLGLQAGETMMVAAHRNDLLAARGCGMLTAFLERPDEFGQGRVADHARAGEFDVMAGDMVQLTSLLGA